MLTFGVVTDEHFGPEAGFGGKLRKLTAQAPELAAAFAARMRAEVRPDFVVNLGDCIEDESRDADLERYRACQDALRGAGVDLVNVAGNHDRIHLDPPTLRAAWGLPSDGLLYRSFDRGGFHFVVLATDETKDVSVCIDDQQLAWLEADLAETTLPTVVLMHHSAADQDLRGNRWFEKRPHLCLVKERKQLRELLARHGRTRLVLNGHLHWNHLDLIDGIPYVTLQSLIENVDDDAPGRAAAAHAVVRLGERRIVIEVAGEQPCRYQFEGA
jgi:3',5'-cyclic AMP phosphodiesterase CpdA